MPASSRDELVRRRETLRLRSAQLRQQAMGQLQVLRRPLGLVDQARAATHWLAQHPQWPLGAAVLLIVLRPRRVLRWTSYAVQGYGLYRRVHKLFAAPRSPT